MAVIPASGGDNRIKITIILFGCDFVIVFCKFDKTFSNNRIIAKQH